MEQQSLAGPDRLAAFPMAGPPPDSDRPERVPEGEATNIARGKAPLPTEAGTIVDTEA
jgi:hypothetical protein